MSIETLRPWIADGVSRRTWFRKRAAEKAPEKPRLRNPRILQMMPTQKEKKRLVDRRNARS
jgi:hypothetical protein